MASLTTDKKDSLYEFVSCTDKKGIDLLPSLLLVSISASSQSCCTLVPSAGLCRWKGPSYMVLTLFRTLDAATEVVIVGDGPRVREYCVNNSVILEIQSYFSKRGLLYSTL